MNNPVYTLFEQYEIDQGLYSMDIDFTLTGQRIREARQYRGWTADVLAEKVDLAKQARIKAYWEAHAEEKAALDAEQKELEAKKESLTSEIAGREIAEQLSVSKSGVNKFLAAFKDCKDLGFPLPEGITNYGIAYSVYGKAVSTEGRDLSHEMPDHETVEKEMSSRKNMTLVVLWNRYSKQCRDRGVKFYSFWQFCENYAKWCEENKETLHFNAVIGQKMEVDFTGKTFQMVDHLTGEVMTIVVFVAVLPYSQYIYAEGMVSTKEPQWITVNNNALQYFGGVPAPVVCDNCKQAVIANRDWIDPELNKDYAEWAEHNHTVILPAKVKKPKYKSSVENAVGILEKGIFHDMEEMDYFSVSKKMGEGLPKVHLVGGGSNRTKNMAEKSPNAIDVHIPTKKYGLPTNCG